MNINQKYDGCSLLLHPFQEIKCAVSWTFVKDWETISRRSGGDGEITIDAIRDVSYADLLGREEVKLDFNSIVNIIKEKECLLPVQVINW